MAELDMEHYDSDDAETSGQVRMHSCNQPCFTGLSHAYSTSVLYVLLLIYGQLLLELANPQPGQRAALPADARSEWHLVSAGICSQSSYYEVSGLLHFPCRLWGCSEIASILGWHTTAGQKMTHTSHNMMTATVRRMTLF